MSAPAVDEKWISSLQYVLFKKKNIPPFITASNAMSWAHASVVERLPAILSNLGTSASAQIPVEFAGSNAAQLTQQYTGLVSQAFIDELSSILKENGVLPPITTGHVKEKWNCFIEGFHVHAMPWFTLEAVFYRLIMDEVAYFEKGLDPFRPQKLRELVRATPVIKHIAESRHEFDLATPEVCTNLLAFSLWSNSSDLSRHPGGVEDSLAQDVFSTMPREKAAHVLIDDSNKIGELLCSLPTTSNKGSSSKSGSKDSKSELGPPKHAETDPKKLWTGERRRKVIIIADNAGIEFISDLLWADVLVSSNRIETVEFHVKFHPTFVSDVTRHDVEDSLVYVEKVAPTLGKRWRKYFKKGIFTVLDHPYYNAYESYWIVPLDLYQLYRECEFVVSKGDANARRFHGDRAWDFTLPTESIINYFPVPLLLIRTFKSETVSGVTDEQIKELTSLMKRDWYHSGEYGSIQLVMPRRIASPRAGQSSINQRSLTADKRPSSDSSIPLATSSLASNPHQVSIPLTMHKKCGPSLPGTPETGHHDKCDHPPISAASAHVKRPPAPPDAQNSPLKVETTDTVTSEDLEESEDEELELSELSCDVDVDGQLSHKLSATDLHKSSQKASQTPSTQKDHENDSKRKHHHHHHHHHHHRHHHRHRNQKVDTTDDKDKDSHASDHSKHRHHHHHGDAKSHHHHHHHHHHHSPQEPSMSSSTDSVEPAT